MDLEPEDSGDVLLGWLGTNEILVGLEEKVWEGCAEVRAIEGGVAGGFGVVNIFAF